MKTKLMNKNSEYQSDNGYQSARIFIRSFRDNRPKIRPVGNTACAREQGRRCIPGAAARTPGSGGNGTRSPTRRHQIRPKADSISLRAFLRYFFFPHGSHYSGRTKYSVRTKYSAQPYRQQYL
jgi:hypothetical protein